jgi:hypothetical protein
LHLWFCSTLLQWQNASRLVLGHEPIKGIPESALM